MEFAPSVVTPLFPLCQTLDRTISEASLNAGELELRRLRSDLERAATRGGCGVHAIRRVSLKN